jgi:hypothetical protein
MQDGWTVKPPSFFDLDEVDEDEHRPYVALNDNMFSLEKPFDAAQQVPNILFARLLTF